MSLTVTFKYDKDTNTFHIDRASSVTSGKAAYIVDGDEVKSVSESSGDDVFIKIVSKDGGLTLKQREANGKYTNDVDLVLTDTGMYQELTLTKDGKVTKAKRIFKKN